MFDIDIVLYFVPRIPSITEYKATTRLILKFSYSEYRYYQLWLDTVALSGQ